MASKLCVDCHLYPIAYYTRCLEHARIYNAQTQREKRARRRQRRELMLDHTRLCIDCSKPFLSHRGTNVCASCIQRVWDKAEATTPLRTNRTVRPSQLNTMLYLKYGHRYKPTVKPTISLSNITVFQSTGRKR